MMRVLALLSEEALSRKAHGCTRSQFLWSEIRSQGVDLKVFPVERSARENSLQALQNVMEAWRPDIIHAEGAGAAAYLPCRTGRSSDAKQSVTFYQLESEAREEAMARLFGPAFQLFSPLARQVYLRRIRNSELLLASQVDLCLALTAQDRLRYQKLCPNSEWFSTRAGVLGRGERRTPQAKTRSVLLVTSFDNAEERQGLRWFFEQIVPRLPTDIELTIASDCAARGLQKFLSRHRCQVIPSHKDLERLYYSHAVCVVPVLSGRGFEHRILEPLSFERAVVTTPMALAGLELARGQGVMVTDKPERFANKISRLLDNPREREAIAEMGCRRTNKVYDWKQVARELIGRWQMLLEARLIAPRPQEIPWQSVQR